MKRIDKLIIGISIGLLCAGTVMGQKAERVRIREGNKLYNKEQFTEAEIAYRKSVEVNPRSFEGAYDLGNALYKQQKYPEAAEQYTLVASQGERLLSENPANVNRLAQVFHNLGNISMQGKDYAKSIEAYKQSLRLNPADDETRYNLALAQKLLENQENQENDQDQQQDKQEQQQDQQEQQQDDQNQNQQPPEQQEEQQQEQPPQNQNMSRENAQQILDAFLQDEKDTQEKVKKEQERLRERRRADRQW
jgi:tetratricopeptide (TPR) repeat protein